MRINQKIFTVALAGLLIVPQLASAAWWNPFTWGIFSRAKAPEAQVQKVSPPPVVVAPLKPAAPTNGQGKNIIRAVAPVKLSNAQIIAKIKPATVYISTDSVAGSGMIFTTDGYVLTNAHVVEGATSVKVSLSTGGIVDGTVIGRDEVADLAVIKLDTMEQLAKVNFGDSDKTQQGDEVFAFGFPFGIEGDVSFKDGTISRRIDEYFETSTEIHPGNSGGPLVNQYGQVIGINTAIFGKSVSGVQLGETIKLAIPINDAKNLILELKAGRNIVKRDQQQVVAKNDCVDTRGEVAVFNYKSTELVNNYTSIENILIDAMKNDSSGSGAAGLAYFQRRYQNFLDIYDDISSKTSDLSEKAARIYFSNVNQEDLANMKAAFGRAAVFLKGYYDVTIETLRWITTNNYWDDYFKLKAKEALDTDDSAFKNSEDSYNDALFYYQKIQKGYADSYVQSCLPPVGSTIKITKNFETTTRMDSRPCYQLGFSESDAKICDIWRNYKSYYQWVITD